MCICNTNLSAEEDLRRALVEHGEQLRQALELLNPETETDEFQEFLNKANVSNDDKAEAKKGKKTAAASTEDATPKKGRGRPKKATPVADAEDDAEVEVAPKKARGRPRKSLPAEEKVEEVDEVEAPSAKKARGRPRKSVTADEE